jgi:hypothetical protein
MIAIMIIAFVGLMAYGVRDEYNRLNHKRKIERRNRNFKK